MLNHALSLPKGRFSISRSVSYHIRKNPERGILKEERRLMVFDYLIRQGKEAPLLRHVQTGDMTDRCSET